MKSHFSRIVHLQTQMWEKNKLEVVLKSLKTLQILLACEKSILKVFEFTNTSLKKLNWQHFD